jgi:hypothetical protein
MQTNIYDFLHTKKVSQLIILIVSLFTTIASLLQINIFIGGWHIIVYILILVPLIYLIFIKKVQNIYKIIYPYTFYTNI